MDVSGLLKDIGLLGIGIDNPSSDDQETWLRFLNLAHLELFRKTAPLNPKVLVLKETVNAIDGVCDNLLQTPFLIKKVYVSSNNFPLIKTSIDEIQKNDPSISLAEACPRDWYYYNNKLNIYPLYTGEIGVFYIPDPTLLEEDTEEFSIPYPISYHPILIDGACYYLFQGEGAFRDSSKMQSAFARWENGKTELMSYLTSLSGQTYYSTFSRV